MTSDDTTTMNDSLDPNMAGLQDEVSATAMDVMAVLPEAVRNYLLSDRIGETRTEIYEKHGLTPEDRDIAMKVELEVFFGAIALEEFADMLWSDLPWEDSEEDRAKTLVLDILGRILMPAQAWVGDVVVQISALGGNPADYEKEAPIEPREVSVADVTNTLVESIGLGNAEPTERKRFASIAATRIKDVRDSTETKAALMKPYKVGGMDMSADEAQQAVDMIEAEMRLSKFIDPSGETFIPLFTPGRNYSPEDVNEIYMGKEDEQEAIAEELKVILKETDKDPALTQQALIGSLTTNESGELPGQWQVVAAILAAATFGGLPESLEEVDEIRGLVMDYLELNNREDEVSEVLDDPTGTVPVNILLQLMLRGQAGLSPEDSARLALRAINAMARRDLDQYKDLVIFDGKSGQFRWVSPIEI